MDTRLNEIVQKIADYVKPEKIFLFGSRARGDARPDSDYDLVVIYDGEISKREVKVGVQKLFRNPAIAMDLLVLTSQELDDYKHIANTLAREITENGMLVYGR